MSAHIHWNVTTELLWHRSRQVLAVHPSQYFPVLSLQHGNTGHTPTKNIIKVWRKIPWGGGLTLSLSIPGVWSEGFPYSDHIELKSFLLGDKNEEKNLFLDSGQGWIGAYPELQMKKAKKSTPAPGVDRLSSATRHLRRCEGMRSRGFPRPHALQMSNFRPPEISRIFPGNFSEFIWKARLYHTNIFLSTPDKSPAQAQQIY